MIKEEWTERKGMKVKGKQERINKKMKEQKRDASEDE